MEVVTYVGVVLLVFGGLFYSYVRIPNNLPRQIPSVPIYISLTCLFSDMGQNEIYDKWLRAKMEKYGAIKIRFAGPWNILITRPKYLSDFLKHEEVYAKAGSQRKIPWSVMASLVGDNLINSHGEDWRL